MTGRVFVSLFLILSFAQAEESLGKSVVFEDKSVITEIHFGIPDTKDKIEVYISPSCLHCGKFVAEELEAFVKKHEKAVILKFLPTSAKDIFIMKIIQNERQDEKSYFEIYKNYIKRAIATINFVNPTKEQIEKYRGSKKDPEMIKFQVIASEFGFSDKKIIAAFPNQSMTESFERSIMLAYSKNIKAIHEIVNTKELDLPLIAKCGKRFRSLDDALRS